jgi:methanogenic corrinoid protein MtbC1
MTDIRYGDSRNGWSSGSSTGTSPAGEARLKTNSGQVVVDDRLLVTIARTIQYEVVPRLLMATRHKEPGGASSASEAIAPQELDEFVSAVMFHDIHVALTQIEALRDRGLKSADIFLGLLAPAARRLGDLWLLDRCSFAEVTMGLVRLQNIMRAVAPPPRTQDPRGERERRVLLTVYPNEQHAFGITLVGQLFTEAGWSVTLMTPTRMAEVTQRLSSEWFDLVGISLSNDSLIEKLTSAISQMRRKSRNRLIGVLVGGATFNGNPDLYATVGANASASDGREAVLIAEGLMGAASHPHAGN